MGKPDQRNNLRKLATAIGGTNQDDGANELFGLIRYRYTRQMFHQPELLACFVIELATKQ